MRAIRCKGAIDVIRFNLPIYLITFFILMFAWALTYSLGTGSMRTLVVCVLVASTFWLLSSIIASHWVYDCSPLSRWTWLCELFPKSPRRWLSIHAGLDETASLRKFFQDDQGISMDIFDSSEMTEPSIARARRIKNESLPAIRAHLERFPFREASFDAVFLVFSLHEVRNAAARSHLITEVKRTLKREGSVFILEHGRNLANFIAFGPGCLHFLPYNVWFQLATEVGLRFQTEMSFTALVKGLLFKLE
ncbi:class I SAM-dependent methyltransferase [bacterium]|nr:class I SAM-dependent methyltransferase [bacterium]MCI0605544.1 class I SAM-dependent methyltransferase [bacterium]